MDPQRRKIEGGKFFTNDDGHRVMNPNGFFNIDQIKLLRHPTNPSKVTFTLDYEDALDLVQSAKQCKENELKNNKFVRQAIMMELGLDNLKQCLRTLIEVSFIDPRITQYDFEDKETIPNDDESGRVSSNHNTSLTPLSYSLTFFFSKSSLSL